VIAVNNCRIGGIPLAHRLPGMIDLLNAGRARSTQRYASPPSPTNVKIATPDIKVESVCNYLLSRMAREKRMVA
jgi:hypothetical protein